MNVKCKSVLVEIILTALISFVKIFISDVISHI